ncbi:sensor histidine kinase [Rhizohabitans arisaemae]|uniref:sensor histidine kinase n=1 Tax=Rhizohabitans arisaemae TaxID=2720610 RepID=UPI0024B0440E|nr:sensor histidine kinase [Rhizohabitans arisaemae]
MSSSLPPVWVSPVIYGAVFAAGLVAVSGGVEPAAGPGWGLVVFAGGLVALLGLDLLERRHPAGVRTRAAVALLVARVTLFTVVAGADRSGLSRALFVLVPFTAYFAFGPVVAVTLAVACAGVLTAGYTVSTPRWYAEVEPLSDLLMFCVGLVLAVSMAAFAVEERRGRARLEESNRRLAEYSARVAELSASAERNRVARDIHDDLGQHLTAVAVLLEKAEEFRGRDPDSADRAVADARRSARRALGEVRRSVRTLRGESGPFGLRTALGDLVEDRCEDGLAVTLEFEGDERGHDPRTLTALYRVAQEGLTNARRHARASRVQVSAVFDGSGARLVVADDGRGFAGAGEGFGLRGMRERVRLAGGGVEIGSGVDGRGTRITVVIPPEVAP